ncbi:TfoX/Sxy family protein [Polluticoccus soli]|uniref:TfoX/Sxy family protein n=1 Tax=Polluticoccus soli TaxID=3034150 RepID=UPI0023E15757|nr:TfoX/Sxy family protein [Flavipsychrobacter sp. JY13-12]
MAKKPVSTIPEESLALFDKLVATIDGIERKGATMPYTSFNGHMFAFLTKEGTLALRLPDAALEEFLRKYKTTLCEQHGTVLKEYAVVPDSLFKKAKDLQPWFAKSYEYIASLKPKPTTKTKK